VDDAPVRVNDDDLASAPGGIGLFSGACPANEDSLFLADRLGGVAAESGIQKSLMALAELIRCWSMRLNRPDERGM
jgi:hypothetical protein